MIGLARVRCARAGAGRREPKADVYALAPADPSWLNRTGAATTNPAARIQGRP
jgi:hypothetical protein